MLELVPPMLGECTGLVWYQSATYGYRIHSSCKGNTIQVSLIHLFQLFVDTGTLSRLNTYTQAIHSCVNVVAIYFCCLKFAFPTKVFDEKCVHLAEN